jgi:hypothetical protein
MQQKYNLLAKFRPKSPQPLSQFVDLLMTLNTVITEVRRQEYRQETKNMFLQSFDHSELYQFTELLQQNGQMLLSMASEMKRALAERENGNAKS